MTGQIAIVSLRCNPAFIQWLVAYAKAFRELGLEPCFVVDPAYQRFSELGQVAPFADLSANHNEKSWTHALFLNPSVRNHDFALRFKQAGARVLYLYHEPWQMSLHYIWNVGLRAALTAFAAHQVTISSLKVADRVVLVSRYGVRMYENWDVRYNKNSAFIPLLYDDEISSELEIEPSQKKYFGYVGGICRAHGFDRFASFMIDSLRRGTNMRFLIASRYPLPSSIAKNLYVRNNLDKVEIRCGRALNAQEMNRCYAECFCIWNAYRISTQSGVLPKAFMFGTPVLVSEIGSFPEFVVDGVNGRFLRKRGGPSIESAIEDMRQNITMYAPNCRRAFLDTFFYRAHLPKLQQLLQLNHEPIGSL